MSYIYSTRQQVRQSTVVSGWSFGTGHSAKSSPVPSAVSRTTQSSPRVTTAHLTSLRENSSCQALLDCCYVPERHVETFMLICISTWSQASTAHVSAR